MDNSNRTSVSNYANQTSREHKQSGKRAVLIPIGAVEQHGPHLPVGTDTWIACEIAHRAAAGQNQVIVAEPLPVGSSGHHQFFPGTISLRPSTTVALIIDVATSIARHGDIPVFINGHGGNRPPLAVALQELLLDDVRAWTISYFEKLANVIEEVFPNAPHAVGHACAMETSIVAYLWPDLLHDHAIPGPGGQESWPDPSLFSTARVQTNLLFDELNTTGVVGEPGLYSPQAGMRLIKTAAGQIRADVDRILGLPT